MQTEKVLIFFTTNIENVHSALLKEAGNVTMRIKINDQINGKCIMKKIETCTWKV